MNIGEWQAKLIEQPGIYGAALYLWRSPIRGTTEFLIGDGTVKTITEGVARSADLAFAQLEGDQLQAIADAFSNFGVKTSNDHKAAGLLEATKYHLEDMRLIALGKRGE